MMITHYVVKAYVRNPEYMLIISLACILFLIDLGPEASPPVWAVAIILNSLSLIFSGMMLAGKVLSSLDRRDLRK